MSRDTYSDREKAIRAEIERQAPDLTLKYCGQHDTDGSMVRANFAWPSVMPGGLAELKGFSAPLKTMFDAHIEDGIVAAQLIAAARHWYAKKAEALVTYV